MQMSFKETLIPVLISFVTLGVKAFLVAGAILGPRALARDLTDVTLEIVTEKTGAEAKQDAFDRATEQATLKLTEELLGPERAAKVWPSLRPKLLKNSTHYVLFIKGTAPVPSDDGATNRVSVSMRLSPDNLESLLREDGVMSSGAVRVLPLVEIDETRSHYMWWADLGSEDKASVRQEIFKQFYSHLATRFKAKNIYVLDPTNASFRMSIPPAYRSENLRREDQVSMALYLKADVVLSGRILAGRPRDGAESKLEYDLQMWQAKSGRSLAEVQRSEGLSSETPKVILGMVEQTSGKALDELAGRLGEALSSGNLNLNMVTLSVAGAMSYRQQAEFKRLLGQLREVRVLKERLFEPTKVIFEIETPVTGEELGKAVQKAHFPLYTIQVQGAQDNSLALAVQALSSASAQ